MSLDKYTEVSSEGILSHEISSMDTWCWNLWSRCSGYLNRILFETVHFQCDFFTEYSQLQRIAEIIMIVQQRSYPNSLVLSSFSTNIWLLWNFVEMIEIADQNFVSNYSFPMEISTGV